MNAPDPVPAAAVDDALDDVSDNAMDDAADNAIRAVATSVVAKPTVATPATTPTAAGSAASIRVAAVPAATVAVTLSLDYLPFAQIAAESSTWWNEVLGVVGFGSIPPFRSRSVPVAASMTPSLRVGAEVHVGAIEEFCEVWRVSGAHSMTSGADAAAGIQYRHCEDLLFGCIAVDERSVRIGQGDAEALLVATEHAHRQIFALLADTGHRHLLRIWNYLPDINGHAEGDERYRHFNAARQRAFRHAGRAATGTVPAASALGSPAGSPLSIYFLASNRPPVMIENPRQVSAYHYPATFGKHSPLFSRACLWGHAQGATLFISGTASIVGHDSRHAGDVVAQTHETLVNIAALLGEANRSVGSQPYTMDCAHLKVYVRRPEDLRAIDGVLRRSVHARLPIVYVQADVCRAELLVEIEAVVEPHPS